MTYTDTLNGASEKMTVENSAFIYKIPLDFIENPIIISEAKQCIILMMLWYYFLLALDLYIISCVWYVPVNCIRMTLDCT